MCSRNYGEKSNRFSGGCVRLVACSLLLLLVASPVWASANWAVFEEKPVTESEVTQEVPVEVIPVEYIEAESEVPTEQISESPSAEAFRESLTNAIDSRAKQSEDMMNLLERFQKEFDNSLILNRDLKNNFQSLMEAVDQYKAVEEVEDTAQQETILALNRFEEANKKQADAIASLESSLKHEKGTQGFMKLNGIIGFKNNLPTWGLGGSLGLKIGPGLLLETGVNYMLGDFVSMPDFRFKLDNMTVTTSIGWQF